MRRNEGEEALKKCQRLEKELRKSNSIYSRFYKSKSSTDGTKTATYGETLVPFFGKVINCNSWSST